MPVPTDALPPFPGFRAEAFQFLRDLKAHNEREWFKPRKATYEDELLWPARCLIAQVSEEAPHHGLPLRGTPKKSVFRIYRDTRFSKNKAPYKTHVGLVLTRTGAKDDPGGLYVHIEPDNCFLAAGFWAPESPFLRRWRERIVANPDGFLQTVEQVEEAGLTLSARDSLKRMPRGFEDFADHPAADYLKWKGTIANQPVADAEAMTPAFTETVLTFAAAAQPLLDFGWTLTDEVAA
ncbi:MAG: DUF2461 domain-containing protein [Rhodothermaceae bacterium]|nr:DUF2461 domain-containing protein [Rhodothermaceae bacterium]